MPRAAYLALLQGRSDPHGALLAALPVLGSMAIDDLFELVLPVADVSRRLYDDLLATRADELRGGLANLARFLAWTSLGPSYGDSPALYGYWPLSDPSEVPALCARARERYAGLALLLEQVDENERGWAVED